MFQDTATLARLNLLNIPDDAKDLVEFTVPNLMRVLQNGAAHGGTWAQQSSSEHRRRAAEHLRRYDNGEVFDDDGETNIAHAITRIAMAAFKDANGDYVGGRSPRRKIWVAGGKAYPVEPFSVDELPPIETIAESLASQTRWTGHAGRDYTVADHSLTVLDCGIQLLMRTESPPAAHQLPRFGLALLLHDAHESVTGDVNTQVKLKLKDVGCFELQRICENFDDLLAIREGLGKLFSAAIIDIADKAVGHAEAELLPIGVPRHIAQEGFGTSADVRSVARAAVYRALDAIRSPTTAADRFLARYNALKAEL